MSNIPYHATAAGTAYQGTSKQSYVAELKTSTPARLAVNAVRVAFGGANTLTKPMRVELLRVATSSISGGTASAGTLSKRNVADAISISGVTCQTYTTSTQPTVTSPTVLEAGYCKPDGGSFAFTAGYYVDKDYSLLVRVTDTNNSADIACDTNFTIDI